MSKSWRHVPQNTSRYGGMPVECKENLNAAMHIFNTIYIVNGYVHVRCLELKAVPKLCYVLLTTSHPEHNIIRDNIHVHSVTC